MMCWTRIWDGNVPRETRFVSRHDFPPTFLLARVLPLVPRSGLSRSEDQTIVAPTHTVVIFAALYDLLFWRAETRLASYTTLANISVLA